MTIKYTFTMTIEIDSAKVTALHGDKWEGYIKESSDEFSQELNTFIDNHPFAQACKLDSTETTS